MHAHTQPGSPQTNPTSFYSEVDVRVTYCVISIASLYGLLTDELVAGVVEYVVACQNYEGGFGGEPGNEAHGGYAFCAVATLAILNALDRIDLEALVVCFRPPCWAYRVLTHVFLPSFSTG